MATWRISNSVNLGGEPCAQWQPNHAYALGARCVCRTAYATTAARAFVYEVTVAGTSHATTEPTWPTTPGNTVVDNGVTWTCRSPNDGNWNNASCILPYVLNYAAVAAGDLVFVDDGHAEALNIAFYTIKGSTTANNPVKIICVDQASDTLSTGASCTSQSTVNNLTFMGFGYSYGITYNGANMIYFYDTSTGTTWILEGAGTTLLLRVMNSGDWIEIRGSNIAKIHSLQIRNGSIQLDNLNNYILIGGNSLFDWKGGRLIAGNGITNLFYSGYRDPRLVFIEDVDLDDVGVGATATALVNVAGIFPNEFLFSRCKLPSDAGFLPTVGSWPAPLSGKVRLHHCSSASKYYDFHEESYEGKIEDETTIVRTGGAADPDSLAQAWKMISSANTLEIINGLKSPPIAAWNPDASEKTFTVECLIDSAANLQNDEVWMEFEYPADAASGLGYVASDKCEILGTPADKSAGVGAGNWGTGGMGDPNSFKCSVTVTPGKAGPVTARIYLAKASTTIYVDPMITIT